MNDFVKQRMDWLIAIAADPKQRGRLPINVAVMLAAKYFNSESGKAWPGIETLAKDLNTDQRNARRAIDWLFASGYLRRSRNRKSGAGHSNTYEMRVKKEGLSTPLMNGQEGGSIDPKRRVYRPPEP
jgi:hypothetical protein